ncbi:MAG: helix-turn-helix domain-containing protein [Thermomicrobiales bacterium]|jgi:cytoskeleton protein RodZ
MAVFGDTLRQARAYKGVTLREAERATRINRYHLAALEEENFSALPPLIYQRGIVRNYATYLDLDPNKLLSLFEEASGAKKQPEYGVVVKPLDMPSHWAPNFAIIAFMVVMSAIVFAWLYSAYFAPSEVQSTPTEIVATVTPVDNEALIMPTKTPKPPTATPKPTDTPVPPTPTTAPTIVPADQANKESVPTQPADKHQTADPTETADVQAADTSGNQNQPADQPPAGMYSIKVTATGADVQLSIVADGETVFEGWLGDGQSTDWYTAAEFNIWTSDGASTLFTNDNGQAFYMGYDPDSTYLLP